ncbi:ComF family protein [Photobacterium aquae]|uniref:ComF family protein n=1 Tax=Photobacterium aquae TaxID=1195763 RepID=UPI000A0252A1|nr:ComF family protein [Photobacterium aquae]
MLSPFPAIANFLRQSHRCQLCQLPTPPPHDYWCPDCRARFAELPYCQHCGATHHHTTPYCGACLRDPPPWQRLYRLGEYRFPLDQLIRQLKFRRHFWLAKPLALALAPQITAPAPVLLPVPLHPLRHLSRGFNQSTLIAQPLANTLDSQCLPRAIRRVRHTPYQRLLTKTERRHNLNHAFALNNTRLPRHVALVDDVVTTGSTLSALCVLLHGQGVERIDIYCLCHTPAIR